MRKPQMITISGAGSCRTPALIGTLMQNERTVSSAQNHFHG